MHGTLTECHLEISGALDISEQVFDYLPVLRTRVGVVLGELGNHIHDVWVSGNGEIHEGSKSGHVWDARHVKGFLGIRDVLPES